MRVLDDRVLMRKNEPETKSAGGIVLASAAEPKFEATVLSVGPGKLVNEVRIPPTVKVGDIVMYNGNAAVTVKVENEELLVIKESEIFGIVEL